MVGKLLEFSSELEFHNRKITSMFKLNASIVRKFHINITSWTSFKDINLCCPNYIGVISVKWSKSWIYEATAQHRNLGIKYQLVGKNCNNPWQVKGSLPYMNKYRKKNIDDLLTEDASNCFVIIQLSLNQVCKVKWNTDDQNSRGTLRTKKIKTSY